MEVLTAAEMRAAEARAMAGGRVTGAELMARAGAGVVAAMAAHRFPAPATGVPPGGGGPGPPGYFGTKEDGAGSRNVVVLCGPGNNGGDGYVVARLLRAGGARVTVLALGDPGRLQGDARRAWQDWNGPVGDFAVGALETAVGDGAVLVDALFGIGQRGPLDAVTEVVAQVRAGGRVAGVVAVDVPTGYDTDNGARLAARPLVPDLVVAFHRAKPVHRLAELAAVPLVIWDIGV